MDKPLSPRTCAAFNAEQRLGITRIVSNCRLLERRDGDAQDTLDVLRACAVVSLTHGLSAEDGINLVLALLSPHRCRATLVGFIFREQYDRYA